MASAQDTWTFLKLCQALDACKYKQGRGQNKVKARQVLTEVFESWRNDSGTDPQVGLMLLACVSTGTF